MQDFSPCYQFPHNPWYVSPVPEIAPRNQQMYLQSIFLENIGPIGNLAFRTQFEENGNPKPVILVGENGSGKSIFLSYIVNALLAAQQFVYDENTEVSRDRVYKLRSPDYIRAGENFSFAKLEFTHDLTCCEWQLPTSREKFEEQFKFTSVHKEWSKIPTDQGSVLIENFHEKEAILKSEFNSGALLYFPHNRFEEPAWLNLHNLNAKAEFTDQINITGYSKRRIIAISPLNVNKNWLFEVLFDRFNLDHKVAPTPVPLPKGDGDTVEVSLNMFLGYLGPSASLYDASINILRTIFPKEGVLRFGISARANRKVALMLDDRQIVPNIFQMSSGETALLNLFLSILRDYDATGQTITSLDEVTGTVLVDEVDLHLHTIHQRKVLPELIRLFPKVQFILTTHSPLFVLGLEELLGPNGYSLLQMPTGEEISAEQFSEFEQAYESYRGSERHAREITEEVEKSRKPLVFVEGDYDVRYLKRASELLGKEEMMSKVEVHDGEGYGGLEKIKRHFDSKIAYVVPQRILLLFDCDVAKDYKPKGKVIPKIIPCVDDHPIKKGIENLFPSSAVQKAREASDRFFDITEPHKKTVRGTEVVIPERWEVNPSEKSNLCDWLITNGGFEDFDAFAKVFEIIEEVLLATPVEPAA